MLNRDPDILETDKRLSVELGQLEIQRKELEHQFKAQIALLNVAIPCLPTVVNAFLDEDHPVGPINIWHV